MLYFFGVIIGYGILSTNPLPLNLHPIFWKSVVMSEELTDEADLFYSDKYSWQILRDIRRARDSLSDDDFLALHEDQKFVLFGAESA